MRILQSASKRIGLRVRREPVSGGAGNGALFPNPIHLTPQNFGREISPVGDGFPNGGILRGNPAGSAGFWISGTEAGNGLLPLYLLGCSRYWRRQGCSSGGEKEYFLNILTGWEGYAILLLPLKGFIFLCKNLAG